MWIKLCSLKTYFLEVDLLSTYLPKTCSSFVFPFFNVRSFQTNLVILHPCLTFLYSTTKNSCIVSLLLFKLLHVPYFDSNMSFDKPFFSISNIHFHFSSKVMIKSFTSFTLSPPFYFILHTFPYLIHVIFLPSLFQPQKNPFEAS